MRNWIVRLLGGVPAAEAKAAVERLRERKDAAFRAAVERAQRGCPEYGVPPLAEYQAWGLLTGCE